MECFSSQESWRWLQLQFDEFFWLCEYTRDGIFVVWEVMIKDVLYHIKIIIPICLLPQQNQPSNRVQPYCTHSQPFSRIFFVVSWRLSLSKRCMPCVFPGFLGSASHRLCCVFSVGDYQWASMLRGNNVVKEWAEIFSRCIIYQCMLQWCTKT